MLAVICCRIFLSSSLLSKSIKFKVHRTTVLPFAFYGYETWPLTLRGEGTHGEGVGEWGVEDIWA
jgi:hypothetical protein